MEFAQLEALAAVVDQGSFDAAARHLHLTQSAVSQRIKALETSSGQVLVRRSRPVSATEAGEAYLRVARQVGVLLAQVRTDVTTAVPVAVNADSLETWVLPALAELDGVTVDLRRADQAHTAGLLRDGTVMAAITGDSHPVAGCRVQRLGTMRYRPRASAAFVERWFAGGVDAESLTRAPVVVFDRDDALQDDFLESRGVASPPPRHHVPSSAPFAEAVARGMGWGMIPDQQADGLVTIADHVADVELFWQHWSFSTPALDAVTRAVTAGATTALAGR